ncbi:MAG: sigma-70 family RNA polymerase sigma factor [Pirellulales bacterium]|nr:sigma-70 family RNA polymerase sigma factor [Pirellulales bacterium]
MSDVTQILTAIQQGDAQAAEQLLPLVYDELRRLASQKLGHESPGHTLQATALVHEAYIRLVDVEKAQHWDSRRHFFAAAAEAMRRILVEDARRKHRKKHGGDHHRRRLHEDDVAVDRDLSELLALDEALSDLAAAAPEKAELVKLRYFAGLTEEQAAETLGISRATAARYWTYARTWLYRRIQGETGAM